MQFPRFQTPSVLLKEYFRNNPEQLRSYLQVGTAAARLAIGPIGFVLKHLIEIQGLDPRTEPGRRAREAFQSALNNTFQKFHDHEYDSDFNFSWLTKKFEEARKSNGAFDLSKEEYERLTDVGNLSAAPPFSVPATRTSTTTEAGVPVTIDQTPVEELASLLGVNAVNQIAPEPEEQVRDVFKMDETWLKAYGDIHSGRLELPNTIKSKFSIHTPEGKEELGNALKRLIEVAKDLEEDNAVDPTELMARTKELKNLKETLKQYATPSRALKKPGTFRRVPTGKTDAVKPTPKTRKSSKPVKKANASKGVFRRVTR